MNAEKLHAIVYEVNNDFLDHNLLGLLQQLVSALTNQVGSPTITSYQEAVTSTHQQLLSAASTSVVNNFSPAWRKALVELNIDETTIPKAVEKISIIFLRNQITPASALLEIQEIVQQTELALAMFDQLIRTYRYLSIGKDELSAGECEFGVMIPREAIGNNLKCFAAELKDINAICETIIEITSGGHHSPDIRYISSSDPTLVFNLDPAAVALFACAIERILASLKTIMEIRVAHKTLKEKNLPSDVLKNIEAHIKSTVKKEIEQLAPELMDKFSHANTSERNNELLTHLKKSLNMMAAKIEKGYNFEVRAVPLPDSEEDEVVELKLLRSNLLITADKMTSIKFIEKASEPFLLNGNFDDVTEE